MEKLFRASGETFKLGEITGERGETKSKSEKTSGVSFQIEKLVTKSESDYTLLNDLFKRIFNENEESKNAALNELFAIGPDRIKSEHLQLEALRVLLMIYATSEKETRERAEEAFTRWGIELSSSHIFQNEEIVNNPRFLECLYKIASRQKTGAFIKYYMTQPDLFDRIEDLDIDRYWSTTATALRFINTPIPEHTLAKYQIDVNAYKVFQKIYGTTPKIYPESRHFEENIAVLQGLRENSGNGFEKTVNHTRWEIGFRQNKTEDEQDRFYERTYKIICNAIELVFPEKEDEQMRDILYHMYDDVFNRTFSNDRSFSDIENSFLFATAMLLFRAIDRGTPTIIIEKYRFFFHGIAKFIPRDAIIHLYERKKKHKKQKEFIPFLGRTVDWADIERRVIERGNWWNTSKITDILVQSKEYEQEIEEDSERYDDDSLQIISEQRFFNLYRQLSEQDRRALSREIFAYLNSGKETNEARAIVAKHYDSLVMPLFGERFVVENNEEMQKLYHLFAERFLESARRYRALYDMSQIQSKKKSKEDEDSYIGERVGKDDMKEASEKKGERENAMHTFFSDHEGPEFLRAIAAFWHAQKSPGAPERKRKITNQTLSFKPGEQVPLLSKEELVGIEFLMENFDKNDYEKGGCTMIHSYLLLLVERRFQREDDIIAHFMGTILKAIKLEAAPRPKASGTAQLFLEFARLYSNLSKSAQRRMNKSVTDIYKKNSGESHTMTDFFLEINAFIRNFFSQEARPYREQQKQVRLMSIAFEDGGDAIANYTEFIHTILSVMPNRSHCRPAEFPKRTEVNTALIEPIKERSTLAALRKGGEIYGRTLVYTEDDSAIHIKFLKKDEGSSSLLHEAHVMDFLGSKKEEWGLQGLYPRVRHKLGRIPQNLVPPGVEAHIEEGYAICMVYEVAMGSHVENPYYTYLNDPDVSHEEFLNALTVNVHDRFVMAQHGLYDIEIIELFHNKERGRRYDWMVDTRHHQQNRHGAGRLSNITATTLYPNIRLSGPADLAALHYLREIIGDPHAADMADNRIKRLLNMRRENSAMTYNYNYIEAAFLGDTLISFMLMLITYIERRSELNYDQEKSSRKSFLQKAITLLFEQSYRAYNNGAEMPSHVLERIDISLMARQIAYFCTNKYITDTKNKHIPEHLYPSSDIHYGAMRRGWNQQKNGWDVENNTQYQIHSRNKKISCVRSSRDLGPVNGPIPLQELIKALYIVCPEMVIAEFSRE